jgi:hypothetical protein
MPPGTPSAATPLRLGFIGYLFSGGDQWKVMLRLRPRGDGDAWTGRLWFSDRGGGEVWDKEELSGPTYEDVLRQARTLAHEELVRRFRACYDERRRDAGLRERLDQMLENVRAVNRLAVRVAEGEMDAERADQEIGRLERELRELLDGVRQAARRATPQR